MQQQAITFLGLWKSFDYQNIGGVDSMVRRMAHELTRRGFAVRFMHYEAPTEQTIGRNQVTSHYFHSFTDLLDALISHSGHIVTIYLRPRSVKFCSFSAYPSQTIHFQPNIFFLFRADRKTLVNGCRRIVDAA